MLLFATLHCPSFFSDLAFVNLLRFCETLSLHSVDFVYQTNTDMVSPCIFRHSGRYCMPDWIHFLQLSLDHVTMSSSSVLMASLKRRANGAVWLLLSAWWKLGSSGKRKPQLKNRLHQIGLWEIFLSDDWCGRAWSSAYCGQHHPWADWPGCIRTWTRGRTSERHSSIVSALIPAWAPALASLKDGVCPRKKMEAEINSFSPWIDLGQKVLSSNRKLTRTQSLPTYT